MKKKKKHTTSFLTNIHTFSRLLRQNALRNDTCMMQSILSGRSVVLKLLKHTDKDTMQGLRGVPELLIAALLRHKQEEKQNVKPQNEPRHNKTNKVSGAPIEDSDQPGHLPSLIRVFAVRLKKVWVLSYLSSAQRRL